MGNKRLTLNTIKNREAIHPYSRKAHQLSRVIQRKEKIAKKQKQKALNPIGERWLWFRYAIEEEKTTVTKPEIYELIDLYLTRNDEEIEELEQNRNKEHRTPKTPRQDLLEALKLREINEFKSGIELPDFTNGKVLSFLREWDGDKGSMSRIKTMKFIKPTEKAVETVKKPSTKKAPQTDMMETE